MAEENEKIIIELLKALLKLQEEANSLLSQIARASEAVAPCLMENDKSVQQRHSVAGITIHLCREIVTAKSGW